MLSKILSVAEKGLIFCKHLSEQPRVTKSSSPQAHRAPTALLTLQSYILAGNNVSAHSAWRTQTLSGSFITHTSICTWRS